MTQRVRRQEKIMLGIEDSGQREQKSRLWVLPARVAGVGVGGGRRRWLESAAQPPFGRRNVSGGAEQQGTVARNRRANAHCRGSPLPAQNWSLTSRKPTSAWGENAKALSGEPGATYKALLDRKATSQSFQKRMQQVIATIWLETWAEYGGARSRGFFQQG